MNILYSVNGEGMGHAVRSKAIITELSKRHNIFVAAGDRSYGFFKKHFRTSKISHLPIVYINNSVSYALTLLYNLIRFPFAIIYNTKLVWLILKFKPDVIITDFEPFSCYYSFLLRKKCICIDNQHIINTKIDKKRFLEKLIVNIMIPKADHYLVTTFFYPEIIKKNTLLFPPINRKEVLKAKPKTGSHILVYQTSKSDKNLVPELKKIACEFIVYGYGKEQKEKNLHLKKFDEKNFIKDLANSKAIITNGGFTLIGEALYLNKPVLSIPVKKQFEQEINAYYLEKLGYGKCADRISAKIAEEFILNLGLYKKNLKKYKKEDNSKILNEIERLLKNQK